MGSLIVNLLGSFTIAVEQQPVAPFRTDKVRALLAYLAVEERPHRRAALAALFWPDIGESYAEKNLRNTLHRLRQPIQALDSALVDQLVVSSRQTIALDPAYFVADVARFTALISVSAAHARHEQAVAEDHYAQCPACLARLTEAADLYQGELLAGFSLADAPAFEEWLLLRREALHQQLIILLFDLTTAFLARAEWKPAQHYARRLLALEPWREEGHRLLMQILARSGQRNAALAQYEQCRQVLMAELGVAPDGQTVALVEQIRAAGEDRETGRQEDRETRGEKKEERRKKGGRIEGQSRGSFTASPNHLVTLSPPPTPAAPVTTARLHNLPINLAPLVGRDQGLAQLHALIGQTRLITIVGIGGMGKSRLALAFAEQLAAATPPPFAHGVWFVSLVGVMAEAERLPDALAGAILNALGITTQNQAALPQALFHYLATRQLLLVLDNFEQFLGEECSVAATTFIQAVQHAAPGITLLVTSRLPLQLLAETMIRLGGLSMPNGAIIDQAEAESYESVRLFVYHARRALPNFTLDDDNLPAVIELCHALSGMPLALELAAALTPHFPPVELVDAIRQNLTILASTRRDLDARHRQFSAVLQSSWQLLPAREQQVLAQCAIFVGRFSRAAVQAITGTTISELAGLIDKALIQQPGVGVYQLHELLRQFASDKLQQDAAGARTVAARHSAYYLNFVVQREARLARSAPRQAVEEIQGEVDNVRHAWAWAADHLLLSHGATTIGAQLEASAYAFWQFYLLTGFYAEGATLFQQAATCVEALLAAPAADGESRPIWQKRFSLLSAISAHILCAAGRHAEAQPIAEQALALSRTIGNDTGELIAILTIAQVHYFTGGAAVAQSALEQVLALSQAIRWGKEPPEVCYDAQAGAYLYLGSIAMHANAYAQAQSYFTQMIALCQRLGKVRALVHARLNLANLTRERLDFAAVRPEYEALLQLTQALRHQWGEGIVRQEFGDVLRGLGEYSSALAQTGQALTILHEMGLPQRASYARSQLGRLYAYMGAYERAWEFIQATITPGHHVASVWGMQEGWLAAVALAQLTGDYEGALHYATSCHQGAQARNQQRYKAIARLCMGFAFERLAQWAEAEESYQDALAIFHELVLTPVLVEAQAGLARVALAQGDPPAAQGWVEQILAILPTQPQVGLDEPFMIYLTCYQILTANADPRASALLQRGGQELCRYAEQITDPELRQSFFANVPSHQTLYQLVTGAADIHEAQKAALRALGAVEE